MLKSIQFFFLIGFFLTACKPNAHVVQSDNQYQELKELKDEDATLTALIAPYKKNLEKEMNTVIGQTAKELTKVQPESTLGNWAVDLVHKKSEAYLNMKIDFAVLNYGGLRIESLPKGDITKSKIFELMPFDNMLVVLEMKGSELPELFHHMAKNGGWPMSKHIKMTAQGNKAVDVKISNRKVENDRVYTIATIDYIANGGDKCTFFKNKKQRATGALFRNSIIEFIQDETKAGRKLDANLERRIFVLK